eukprot:453815_1
MLSNFQILVSSIGTVCTVSIIICVTIDTINNINNHNKTKHHTIESKWRLLLISITIVALLCYLFHSTSVSLIHANIYPPNDLFCTWLARINTAIYHCTRCTFYTVLIIRVYLSFNNSIYKYNVRLIICLFIIVSLWWTFAMIGDLIIDGIGGYYSNDINSCQPIFQMYGIIMSGLVDFTLSIICLILFIKPLIKLNKLIKIYANMSVHTNVSEPETKTKTELQNIPTTTAQTAPTIVTVQSKTNTKDIKHKKTKNKRKARDDSLDELIYRYALLVIIAVVS